MANLLLFPMPPDTGPSLNSDAAARRDALDPRRSFIVEAPAGSGKTGLLIQRYLTLLTDPSVTSPEQVLALTFTIKATAEMQSRIVERLVAANLAPAEDRAANPFERETLSLAAAVLARDRQLGWNLLDNPHRLNIRTIDSVCSQIASALPVLSGSGGKLAPARDASPLFHEAARRTLLQLGSSASGLHAALRDVLLHRDNNLANCESLLADMLRLRDQWGELIPLGRENLDDAWLDDNVLPRLQHALDAAICAGLARLSEAIPPDFLDDLTQLAADFGELDGYKGAVSPLAMCAGRRTAPEATHLHLSHWRALIRLLVTPSNGEWRKSFSANHLLVTADKKDQARLKALIDRVRDRDDILQALCSADDLPPAEYPADQWHVARSLFRVLGRALVELQIVFAERAQCDFTELNLLARHALRDDAGVEDLSAALGHTLQHLLVDEMQDTSTSQYELIHLLTASWDGHSQTVFFVGDPRQSIYLFRQARVERFLRTMRTGTFGDLRLTRLRLTANFRSQATLVAQFNETFTRVFPNGPLPYQAVEATRPPSPVSSGLAWHTRLLRPHIKNVETPTAVAIPERRRQANEIRRLVASWLTRPYPPGHSRLANGKPRPWQIAVLVRNRLHLAEIVSAFKSSNEPIPYRAVEIDALAEQQEILDLTALTRALLHPADRVAALAVLHGPMCGLALAELHLLTGADDPAWKHHTVVDLIAERGHLLPDDAVTRVRRVWEVLTAAARLRARLTPAQLVRRAWRSLGGDLAFAPSALTNTGRFFTLLDEVTEPGGRIDLSVLTDRLKNLYAEPAGVPDNAPFVELLTIHKAKGLEWDVVIVPALERTVMSNHDRLLNWSELDLPNAELDTGTDESLAPVMLAPIAGKGEASKDLNNWLRGIERARAAAEAKRLFYVACTRARLELHLFAMPGSKASGEPALLPDSLLNVAWAAAEPHFAGLSAPSFTAQMTPPAAPATVIPQREPAEQTPWPQDLFDLAAVADAAAPTVHRPPLYRLPLAFDPAERLRLAAAAHLPYGTPAPDAATGPTPFARPEGSFAARSFGNAVHAFLELLAERLAAGSTAPALLAELPSWSARIAAVLRADGLPAATVDRLTRATRSALDNTLRDDDGLWLLQPAPSAANELALTVNHEGMSTIRVDRLFEAGPEPRVPPASSGQTCLWIVDYKSAEYKTSTGNDALEEFLAKQRETYAPQLETYAAALTALNPGRELRLALYYPAIPRLIWWKPAPA